MYVLRCLNVSTVYSINIVNYINSFLYVKPISDSWGNVFNSQFAPFSLPSSSLLHRQTKLFSPALALEKALCSWMVTLSSPAHRNTLLHGVEVWWGRVGGWMRLMLWLRLLRIPTSHARSHVLMWRSFKVQLVSMEKPILPAAQPGKPAIGTPSSRTSLSLPGLYFILVCWHPQFSEGFNESVGSVSDFFSVLQWAKMLLHI